MLRLKEITDYLHNGYRLYINKNNDIYNCCIMLDNRKNSVEDVIEVDAIEELKTLSEISKKLFPGRYLTVSVDREKKGYRASINMNVIEGVCYKGILKRKVVDDYEVTSHNIKSSLKKLDRKILRKRFDVIIGEKNGKQ